MIFIINILILVAISYIYIQKNKIIVELKGKLDKENEYVSAIVSENIKLKSEITNLQSTIVVLGLKHSEENKKLNEEIFKLKGKY